MRKLTTLLFVLSVSGCLSDPGPPAPERPTTLRTEAEKQPLRDLVKAKRAALVQAQANRNEAWETYRTEPPSFDGPACPKAPSEIVGVDDLSFRGNRLKLAVLDRSAILIPDRTKPFGLTGKHKELDRLESDIDDPIEYSRNLEKKLDELAVWPRRYELLLDLATFSQATLRPGSSFRPGSAVGRILIWDYQPDKVICHGPIRASSSGSVSVYTQAGETPKGVMYDTSLLSDLIMNAALDGVDHLVEAP